MSEPAARLAWTDFVYDLAELLRANGVAAPLYLVGGAVRDACLRGAIQDIDIAVEGEAITIARWVADWLDADIYIMDHERGVARVFVNSANHAVCIDFARLRGESLAEDLLDRDFTLNAMAADLLGEIEVLIDPLGGLADLNRKTLRRCSANSIANDPIRGLRAVRLSAQFELKIHPDTAADIRQHAHGLAAASGERVRDEFFKLLGLDRAARALRVLRHLGLLGHIAPGIGRLAHADLASPQQRDDWTLTLAIVGRMSAILTAISSRRTDNTAAAFDLSLLVIQFDRYRAVLQQHMGRIYGNGRRHSELLILGALLSGLGRSSKPDDGVAAALEAAASLTRSLKLTVSEGRKLTWALENMQGITLGATWPIIEQHRFWHKLGDSGIDAILLGAAHVLGAHGGALAQRDWLEFVEGVTALLDTYFNRHDELVEPRLLLDGNDIQALLGIGSGPVVGRLLTALREAQVTATVTTEAEAREYVKSRADAL